MDFIENIFFKRNCDIFFSQIELNEVDKIDEQMMQIIQYNEWTLNAQH